MKREIIVHPHKSENVVIIYPGFNGTIGGYNNKYLKIAELLVKRGVGAVVRIDNFFVPGVSYEKSVKDHLREVIVYVRGNADKICGNKRLNIFLMGISAGAGAAAAVVFEYSCVKKILLVAPSTDAGVRAIRTGLGAFGGEVYVVVGENDEIVGKDSGLLFFELATGAKSRKLVAVPNCDHQFRGGINGRILSKAPLWAFAGDDSFPSPSGGIKLYD